MSAWRNKMSNRLDIINRFYDGSDEDERLSRSRHGQLEYFTTMHYIHKMLPDNGSIIELGAGTGRYSVALAREGYTVTAVELAERNYELLLKNGKGIKNLRICRGDALDLSRFEDSSFDLTLVFGPLYHLYNPDDQNTALREAVRVTKPGGMIMVAFLSVHAILYDNYLQGNLHSGLEENFTADYQVKHFTDQLFTGFNVDEFEAPDEWIELASSMFHEWDGVDADAQPLDKEVKVDWNMNRNASGGSAVVGFVSVDHNQYADISQYEKLVLRGSGSGLRILANRLVPHGAWKQIVVSFNDRDPYWDAQVGAIVIPLEEFRTMLTTDGEEREDDFVHLHALKVDWNQTLNLRGAYLVPSEETVPVIALNAQLSTVNSQLSTNKYYTLQGVEVEHPTHGVYIYNGRKVYIK